MSLAPLAVLQDVIDRAPRTLTSDEQTRATKLLSSASNKIRAWTRQDFTQGQTTITTPPVDNQIMLPQRPVISVDSVARVMPFGTTITAVAFAVWIFDGIATITLGPPNAMVNAPAFWFDIDALWRNITYQVQYTHGYTVIPDDVVDVCSQMVVRQICKPGAEGAQSEMIGGYSYRLQSDYPSGFVALTDDDMGQLRKYRGSKNRTIELG